MASVFGIDVSGWVASPDWGAVSNQGVKFVFVKASENTLADFEVFTTLARLQKCWDA